MTATARIHTSIASFSAQSALAEFKEAAGKKVSALIAILDQLRHHVPDLARAACEHAISNIKKYHRKVVEHARMLLNLPSLGTKYNPVDRAELVALSLQKIWRTRSSVIAKITFLKDSTPSMKLFTRDSIFSFSATDRDQIFSAMALGKWQNLPLTYTVKVTITDESQIWDYPEKLASSVEMIEFFDQPKMVVLK